MGGKVSRRHGLVLGYLERISSAVFSDFPKQLTGLVGRQHGVYALYKGDKLYYVGLASNLRGRIKNHLRDRHQGKWDRFSLYLVHETDHVKELESLALRIAEPKGNRFGGRFVDAVNLGPQLRDGLDVEHNKRVSDIFGPTRRRQVLQTKHAHAGVGKRGSPPLAPHAHGGFPVMREYKGVVYKAQVLADGRVRYNGATYNAPSTAGCVVRGGKHTNGWRFWKFQNARGEWISLDVLRKR